MSTAHLNVTQRYQAPGAPRLGALFARIFGPFLRVFRAAGPPQVPARGRFRIPIFFTYCEKAVRAPESALA